MNFKITNIFLILIFLLISQTVVGGPIEDFSPEEQVLIKRFYRVATGAAKGPCPWIPMDQETIKQQSQELVHIASNIVSTSGTSRFSKTDLFTTTFMTTMTTLFDMDDDAMRDEKNFLLDYSDLYYKDIEFFEEVLLNIPGDIDAIIDAKGQTALMRFAGNCSDNIGIENKKIRSEINLQCFNLLLRRGANLNLKDHEGYDTFSIALLSYNVPIINFIRTYLQKNKDIILNEETQILRDIYEGKIIVLESLSKEPTSSVIKNMYRVSNQSQNYKMVDDVYQQFFDKYFENIFLRTKESYYFYPPLWAYNISQIKNYAISIAQQLQKHLIEEKNLTEISKDYYTYNDGTKTLLLFKKSTSDVSRILGRNHMEKVIKDLGYGEKYGVPQKFLTLPSGDIHTSEIEIQIPSSSDKEGSLYMGGGLNPIHVRINGAVVYAEVIEAEKREDDMKQDRFVRIIGTAAGFIDYGGGNSNFIWGYPKSFNTSSSAPQKVLDACEEDCNPSSESRVCSELEVLTETTEKKTNNKIYFIDTEGGKNFIQREMQNPYNEARIKSYCFDPRIRSIRFNLSEEDFTAKSS